MIQLDKKETTDHLYLEVYRYYRDLIQNGKMLPGSKMPSLRKCAAGIEIKQNYHRKCLSSAGCRRIHPCQSPKWILCN